MGNQSAHWVAKMGLLGALCLCLSFLEHLIPLDGMLPPGVKPGFSNLVVLYAVCYLHPGSALLLVLIKSGFAFLFRGMTAGFLSLCGGLTSTLVMMLLYRVGKGKIHILPVSVCGAVAHNLGQLGGAFLLMQTGALLYYLPLLLFFGVGMGMLNAVIFRFTSPYFRRIG